jgi:alkylhydroperoxidase/carboxymuconolactone decarboxylase family protein YurZ
MARPEDVEIVRVMKNAKTPQEMILSWAAQSDGKNVDADFKYFRLFIERKPEMIETFAQNILWRVLDRGILDAKTRSMINLSIALATGNEEGVIAQCANAKGAGWTEEEIMEASYLVCYQSAKGKMVAACGMLSKAFEATANVKAREKKS